MEDLSTLYSNAASSPQSLSFAELCKLAQLVGFEYDRSRGSHRIFKHKAIKAIDGMMNFQNDNGKAKTYQVRQLLAFIDKHHLVDIGD